MGRFTVVNNKKIGMGVEKASQLKPAMSKTRKKIDKTRMVLIFMAKVEGRNEVQLTFKTSWAVFVMRSRPNLKHSRYNVMLFL